MRFITLLLIAIVPLACTSGEADETLETVTCDPCLEFDRDQCGNEFRDAAVCDRLEALCKQPALEVCDEIVNLVACTCSSSYALLDPAARICTPSEEDPDPYICSDAKELYPFCFCDTFKPEEWKNKCAGIAACETGVSNLTTSCQRWHDGDIADCPIAISAQSQQIAQQFIECPCNGLKICETARGKRNECYSNECKNWLDEQSKNLTGQCPVPDLKSCECWGTTDCPDWNQAHELKCPLGSP